MRVYLLQHGEAVPEAVDPERPLSRKGAADVARTARGCRAARVSAAEVLHSGRARARQSAEILAGELGIPCRAAAGLDPLDPAEIFAAECAARTQPFMVAGHLPFLERLVSFLVTGRTEPAVTIFQRGGMVCLEKRPDGWAVLWTLFPDQPHIVKD
jgi:phosphohistidine phosphatase